MEIQAATSVIHLEHVAGKTRFVAAGVLGQIPVEDVEMNASDTPRTDAELEDARNVALEFGCKNPPPKDGENIYVVSADFARTLERELSEALENQVLPFHTCAGKECKNKTCQLRQNRDQWRECAAELAKQLEVCHIAYRNYYAGAIHRHEWEDKIQSMLPALSRFAQLSRQQEGEAP